MDGAGGAKSKAAELEKRKGVLVLSPKEARLASEKYGKVCGIGKG